MRFTDNGMRKWIGILSILVILIGMTTGTAVQTSAYAADIAVSETTVSLTRAEIPESVFGLLVFIIIFLVLALVAVVVLLFVLISKKKENNKLSAVQYTPTLIDAQNYHCVQPMDMSGNPAANQPMKPVVNRPIEQPISRAQDPEDFGADDPMKRVTVEGASETVSLDMDSVAFTLKRKIGGEEILINQPDFYIGKERSKVDYCITNNNSISRRHAKLKVRAGKCYIRDLGSTNCTYINGTKLAPNQEVALIPGDRVRLSNEEFEFIG